MALTGTIPLPQAAARSRPGWDRWLLGAVLALVGVGLVMVYSASIATAGRTAGGIHYFLFRHTLAVGVGLLAMATVMQLRVRVWERLGPVLMALGIALLIAVLIPGIGVRANGSARWIPLGFATVQPSELMKLAMVAYVAGYLVRRQDSLKTFTQGIIVMSAVLALIGMLMLLEPDLGAVVVLCSTVFTMLFLGGVRFWHFMVVVGAGLGGMIGLTVISPYRWARVTGFLDPWSDPFNTGFQLTQALIAFGRGEWWGVGLGGSVQKLYYLPAAHTDFVLAVLAEELGLLGTLGVIALFGIIVLRAFAVARRAERLKQIYAARLAQGLGTLIGLQSIINMAVNMGLLPTKGLTLPFLSYGGTSVIVSCIAAGILLRIERETRVRSADGPSEARA
jgi:cell division protein FtsW